MTTAFRAIVATIQARVIHRPLDPDPVCLVNAAPIVCRRTIRKSGSNLDPTVLLLGDRPNLVSDFRKILILAEDQGHVVLLPVGHTNDVQRDSNINTLFFPCEERMLGTVRQRHTLATIAQRARVGVHPLTAQHRQLVRPEIVPVRVVIFAGHAGIEPDLHQIPAHALADRSGERANVVVRIGIAE